jgi:hypothetical protein
MVAALIEEQRSVAYCCGAIDLCTDYHYDDETTARALQKTNAQSGSSGRICKLSISELLTASPTPVNRQLQVSCSSLVSCIRVPFAYQSMLANGTSAAMPSMPYADCWRLPPSSSPYPRLCSDTFRHLRRSAVDGRCLWTSGHRADLADMVFMTQYGPDQLPFRGPGVLQIDRRPWHQVGQLSRLRERGQLLTTVKASAF